MTILGAIFAALHDLPAGRRRKSSRDQLALRFLTAPEWNQTLETIPSFPYFVTPKYINAWIRHYAPGLGRARALLVEASPDRWRIVAFAEVRVSRYLPLHTLVAAPEGGYGVAGAGAMEAGWFEAALRRLRRLDVNSFEITPGPELSEPNLLPWAVETRWLDAWIVDLSSGYERWLTSALDKRTRRQLRHAEAQSVRTERAGIEGLDRFWVLYSSAVRGDPARHEMYPRAFLADLMAAPGPGDACLYLTSQGERLVAGGLLLCGGSWALAWIGAMDRSFAALHGNLARHAAVIRDLAARGVTSYNLGAAPGLPAVAEFKRKLGAVPHRYATIAWANPFWDRLRTAVRSR